MERIHLPGSYIRPSMITQERLYTRGNGFNESEIPSTFPTRPKLYQLQQQQQQFDLVSNVTSNFPVLSLQSSHQAQSISRNDSFPILSQQLRQHQQQHLTTITPINFGHYTYNNRTKVDKKDKLSTEHELNKSNQDIKMYQTFFSNSHHLDHHQQEEQHAEEEEEEQQQQRQHEQQEYDFIRNISSNFSTLRQQFYQQEESFSNNNSIQQYSTTNFPILSRQLLQPQQEQQQQQLWEDKGQFSKHCPTRFPMKRRHYPYNRPHQEQQGPLYVEPYPKEPKINKTNQGDQVYSPLLMIVPKPQLSTEDKNVNKKREKHRRKRISKKEGLGHRKQKMGEEMGMSHIHYMCVDDYHVVRSALLALHSKKYLTLQVSATRCVQVFSSSSSSYLVHYEQVPVVVPPWFVALLVLGFGFVPVTRNLDQCKIRIQILKAFGYVGVKDCVCSTGTVEPLVGGTFKNFDEFYYDDYLEDDAEFYTSDSYRPTFDPNNTGGPSTNQNDQEGMAKIEVKEEQYIDVEGDEEDECEQYVDVEGDEEEEERFQEQQRETSVITLSGKDKRHGSNLSDQVPSNVITLDEFERKQTQANAHKIIHVHLNQPIRNAHHNCTRSTKFRPHLISLLVAFLKHINVNFFAFNIHTKEVVYTVENNINV